MIRRRRFVAAVALGVLAAPRAGEAQQPAKVPRVGVLYIASSEVAAPYVRATEEGFRELGYAPSKTIILEQRFADGDPERLRQLAAELVKSQVDIIITNNNATIAAVKEATSVIPIVMRASSDPVRAGFVQSLARPGGNITGLTTDAAPDTMVGKELALLREILPGLSRIAVLWNPTLPLYRECFKSAEGAARQLGITLQSLEISAATALETRFTMALQNRGQAMLVFGDHVTITLHRQIATLAIKNRVPTIGFHREFVEVGGLMCYGVNLRELVRRGAYYVDRILRGAKPADLPIEQPTKFEMVINLKTAKALGLTIPQSVLLQADQLIE
jgi:putative ABC transport system substrate-binding protein